jgi:bifunctional non-homologous end joining protein LigD
MASFDPYAHVIKPMLAESRETPFDSPDFVFELKWDGTRALAFVRNGKHRFQNRRLSSIEGRYPDLAPRLRKDAIVDGEIVVMDGVLPSFERLQERERASGTIRVDYLARTLPATYIVFDVLYVGEREVMSLPQVERKALLREIVDEDEHVVLSDAIEGRGVDYYNAVVAKGLEGIIAKRKDARYYPGRRSPDWIKIKKKASQDCVIAGVTVGEGERRDTFGSIVLGAYHGGQLVHVGRVGTGFSEALRRSLTERLRALRQDACPFPTVPDLEVPIAFWTRPVLVAEVHFLEWSKERHMRAPSFSHMREDKQPEDCIANFPKEP